MNNNLNVTSATRETHQNRPTIAPSRLLKKADEKFKVVNAFGKVLRSLPAVILREELANKPSVVKSVGSLNLLALIKLPLLTAKTFEEFRLSNSYSGLGLVGKGIERTCEGLLSFYQIVKGSKALQIMDAARFPWLSTVMSTFAPVYGTIVAVPTFISCYRSHSLANLVEASKKETTLKGRLSYISERTTDKKIKSAVEGIFQRQKEGLKDRNEYLKTLANMDTVSQETRKKASEYITLLDTTSGPQKRKVRSESRSFARNAEMSNFLQVLEVEARRQKIDSSIKASAALADTIGAVCLFAGATMSCNVFVAAAAIISFADVIRPKDVVASAA
jgi:hypothetical protein